MDEDEHLSKLFGTKKSAAANSLVGGFRDDLLNELLQLVEVVLVQKQNETSTGQIDPEVLESRLASVMSPKNSQNDKTSQLQILDAYLAEKHGKDVLAQAIDMVKPFFLSICHEKLE